MKEKKDLRNNSYLLALVLSYLQAKEDNVLQYQQVSQKFYRHVLPRVLSEVTMKSLKKPCSKLYCVDDAKIKYLDVSTIGEDKKPVEWN